MSRDAILRDIRAALGRTPDEHRDAAMAAGRRLAAPARHLVPKVGCAQGDARTALFIAAVERQSTRVLVVPDASAIPSALSGFLSSEGVPPTVRIGSDRFLADLPWDSAPTLKRATGCAEADDTASLSHALAGVAETGTLVLASGADNPTSLAFLVDTHIIAVAEDAIVGCYEEAFDKMRATEGKGRMPRALNLISGASRTGDIGGRIVLGAHGPRRLAVIIYGRGTVTA